MIFQKKKKPQEKPRTALDEANDRMKKVRAIQEANQKKIAQEQYDRIVEYERLQRKIASERNYAQQGLAAIGALPAPNPSHTHSYTPGGGGGASSGGGMHYHSIQSSDHPRASIDVGTLIKQAVEEASKDFKLTVEAMQEQIDELWEVIRELEDG